MQPSIFHTSGSPNPQGSGCINADPNVVELQNVTKQFSRITAVDNVSFRVSKGQIISLLGPSGCGKTTTLKLIAGFEEPDAGKVIISGKDVTGWRPYERNVGLVFQDYALFPHMTVGQNIAYGLRRRHIDRAEIPSRMKHIMRLVALDGYEDRWPSELSGGQQQRVALARALITRPQVTLLDEPLSALDAKLRQELRIELRKVLTSVGSTTIIVTHDQHEAMTLADHIVIMSNGRLIQQGTPSEIYHRPQTKFVAEFVGRSNWFAGELGSEVELGVFEFHSAHATKLYVSAPPQRKATKFDVCLRPEHITILPRDEQPPLDAPRANVLTGTVVHQENLGGIVEFLIQLECGSQVCVIDKSTCYPSVLTNTPVYVKFEAAHCALIPIS